MTPRILHCLPRFTRDFLIFLPRKIYSLTHRTLNASTVTKGINIKKGIDKSEVPDTRLLSSSKKQLACSGKIY